MKITNLLFALSVLSLSLSCDQSDSEPTNQISILSATIDGVGLSANENVSVDATIELIFTAALDPAKFSSALSFSSGPTNVIFKITYANGGTKATLEPELEYDQSYALSINTDPIGLGGERLLSPLEYSFSTAQDDVIRSMAPCVSAGSCMQSVELPGTQGLGTFQYYSNYPIFEENAQWENLTQAIIVVHGSSHDPENYFSYLTNTLHAESLSQSTVLIAPYFRDTSTGSGEDFYWSGSTYRQGNQSSNVNKISSFEVLDRLIEQLANSSHFPVLDKIIITGHSSGAAFTHVFAASNTSESTYPTIEFEYVVANSQFFYYPDGQRINESNNALYTPSGCAGYTIWPLGYNSTPLYLTGTSAAVFNNRFVNRSITYLLGNGNQSDPTLNTTDCENTLQGSTRYQRGENMYRYMELVYPAVHHHTKTIVNGIGHDGSGMYQSTEFRNLLVELLQQ